VTDLDCVGEFKAMQCYDFYFGFKYIAEYGVKLAIFKLIFFEEIF
jgi:hypothetical protein